MKRVRKYDVLRQLTIDFFFLLEISFELVLPDEIICCTQPRLKMYVQWIDFFKLIFRNVAC